METGTLELVAAVKTVTGEGEACVLGWGAALLKTGFQKADWSMSAPLTGVIWMV